MTVLPFVAPKESAQEKETSSLLSRSQIVQYYASHAGSRFKSSSILYSFQLLLIGKTERKNEDFSFYTWSQFGFWVLLVNPKRDSFN